MNTWGCFFIFFKSSFLGPWDPFRPKSLGQRREVKNYPIILKFTTLIDGMNVFSFFENLLLGPWDQINRLMLILNLLYDSPGNRTATANRD